MKRAAILSALLVSLSLAAAPPSPNDFLKLDIGADRVLADYKQIASYFHALAASSPRVRVETIGKTTLGEDEIMAIISSEENMRNLDKIRGTAARLSDPRGLSEEQANALIRDGKAIVIVTCNIRSTEIAPSQMAMEWPYALPIWLDAISV